jgi:hypothetical protein
MKFKETEKTSNSVVELSVPALISDLSLRSSKNQVTYALRSPALR